MKGRKAVQAVFTFVLMLALVLAGCSGGSGGNDGASAGTQGSGGDSGADGASAAGTNDEIEFPPKDKITLKMVGVRHKNVSVDYNEMPLFQNLEQQSNVHVDWNLISGDVAQEKMNLIFATNDLPDAFFGPSTIDNISAETDITKQLIPLDELIEKYAPNVQAMFEDDPKLKNLVTHTDGKIYYLPMVEANPSQSIPAAMFINKKWLDDLGLPVPETIEQFEDALRAFKEKDPNGNGKADEIPFSFRADHHIQGPEPLAAAFGKGLPSGGAAYTYIEDGKVAIAPALPEVKDYYVWLNKLYKENLIDQEVFTQDENVFKAKLQSPEPIVGAFFAWSESWAFGGANEDYVPLLPLKGADGSQGWNVQSHTIQPKSFAITTANKHPEITMAWVDQFYSEEGTIEVSYGPIGVMLRPEGDQFAYNDPPEGMTMEEWTAKNVPTFYAPRYLNQARYDRVIKKASSQEKLGLTEMYRPYVPAEYYPSSILYEEQDQVRINQWNTDVFGKNALYQMSYAKMVVGDDPEKAWEEMVANMKNLGLDEITEIYQKYYDQLTQ